VAVEFRILMPKIPMSLHKTEIVQNKLEQLLKEVILPNHKFEIA
jgi:hypothetical protein